jgi:predicted signal transduction protein with EAL and GGDEF domain
MSDITGRRNAEERLIHDALHDSLTGLPNRTLLMDRLAHCLTHLERDPGYGCALLYIDVDRFKLVNDSLSHAAGDRLLVELARRVGQALRPTGRPLEFIPVAEESGLISQLGALVLRDACQTLSDWRRRQLVGDEVTVSVNVSIRQITDGAWSSTCTRRSLRPSCLRAIWWLEITESTLIENPQLVRAVLREPHELGVTVEPAEGIEDAEQLNALTALGREYGQGFHFGRPLPAGEIETLLGRRQQRSGR